MTHFGGKSASKIDPPLTHLPVSWMSEASLINAEKLLDLPLGVGSGWMPMVGQFSLPVDVMTG